METSATMDDFEDKNDTKRVSRNLSEKKRRDQFNTLLTELGNMLNVMPETNEGPGDIPMTPGGTSNKSFRSHKMDKTTILKSTISFLRLQHDKEAQKSSRLSQTPEFTEDLKPSFLSSDAFT